MSNRVQTISVPTDITYRRIADLFVTAVESGDPVTTASKGGWCYGLYWQTKSAEPPDGNTPWYDQPALYERPDFQIEVWEVADENAYRRGAGDEANIKSGALKVHAIRREQIAAGLQKLATSKHAHHFADIVNENDDAATADIFLQFVCFGEERYA
jgi:hypothetical protein